MALAPRGPKILLRWEKFVIAGVPVAGIVTLVLELYYHRNYLAGFAFLFFAVQVFICVYIADQVRYRLGVRAQVRRR